MRAFILCAGSHERWNGPSFKQLVMVQGEVLLDRTIRQLRAQGIAPYVASKYETLSRPGSTWISIPHTRCTLDTVRQTNLLWTDPPVFILCGDVYWTDKAINLFYHKPNPQVTFYTDTHEIFGIRIDDLELIRNMIEKIAPQYIKDGPNGRAGRLGRLYRELVGKSDEQFDYGTEIGPVNGQFCEYVLDDTTDFDSYEYYKLFRQCLEGVK